jgi:hypothetical protein
MTRVSTTLGLPVTQQLACIYTEILAIDVIRRETCQCSGCFDS